MQPTYVRFTDEQTTSLDQISADYSVERATVIRGAVRRFLTAFFNASPDQRAGMLIENAPGNDQRAEIMAAIEEIGPEQAMKILTKARRKRAA